MPSDIPFVLVDVFTDRPLEGNPLAIVPDADGLPEPLLPRIAREFNQAETTFLLRPTVDDADWRLRSFTAGGVEVYGAGHNALGAWWWLADSGRLEDRAAGQWRQQLGSTALPVTVSRGGDGRIVVSMRQHRPQFAQELTDHHALATALGVEVDGLGAAERLPVAQVVSTGAAHLLVGLRDRRTVDLASPDAGQLRALLPDVGGQGVYLYALNPAEPGAHAHARFVNPVAGITEDPATGSAAGPLASLLSRHGYVGEHITIVQGHKLQRPSQIRVSIRTADDAPSVSGGAALAATGQLRLPV